MKPDRRLRVAILGATGAVGQRFVALLSNHPWFEMTRVAASERSAGKTYRDACHWLVPSPMPKGVAPLVVTDLSASDDIDLAFSALTADVAGEVEVRWAQAGVPVFSNARNHRMEPDVPLMIPEVNPDHLQLIPGQRESRQFPASGFLVTNANCSVTFLAMALAPLHRTFGVELVSVVTMQAVSGAGYPGLSALDISGNVIPFISGEEEKLESETQKILGILQRGAAELHDDHAAPPINPRAIASSALSTEPPAATPCSRSPESRKPKVFHRLRRCPSWCWMSPIAHSRNSTSIGKTGWPRS